MGLLTGLLVRSARKSTKVSLGKWAFGGAICGAFAPSLIGFGKYIYSCLGPGMDLHKAAFVPWPIVLLPLGAGLGAASGLLAGVFGGPAGEDESRGERTKRSVGMGAKIGAKFGFIAGFALFIGLFVYRFVTPW